MKRLSVLSSALLLLGAAAFGQGLTQADRERGVTYLEQTRDGVVESVKGLSEAQMKLKRRQSAGRWRKRSNTLQGRRFYLPECHGSGHEAPAGPAGRDTAKIDAMVWR